MHAQTGVVLSRILEQARVQFGRRYRQTRVVLSTDGLSGIATGIHRIAAEWFAPKNVRLPVRRADVIAADLSRPFQPLVPTVATSDAVFVNWVVIPAGPTSGGYTTLFRIISYLESHGYVNRIYFYNVYGGDHRYYESIVRHHYGFHGKLASIDDGMEDAHAVVATAWPTAYPVFNSRCKGKRFYFVQDFEPFFYPVGALSFLAENTYRMGFHAITAGRWLAQKLSAEFGLSTDSFEFGCDTSRYYRQEDAKRSGVVFYARPEAERRGFELGLMAIEVFAARRPEIEVHFYGAKIGNLPFRFVDHGRISPDELNRIYNRCYAGLSLSLTNVSLVPHEMLAAGCIPVVNDTVPNRLVLDNPFVCYAPSYPEALASELEALVITRDFDSISRASAASVVPASWDNAGATVDMVFRRAFEVRPRANPEGVSVRVSL
jgi:hypothetical protein